MTTVDFSAEFDLLYNNILSNSGPEINPYEKSLLLTQAQEEIIKEAYDSKTKQTFFESKEAIRRRLDQLSLTGVSTYSVPLNSSLNALKMDTTSKFFKINDDVWYITYERCNSATTQQYVVPTALDQYTFLKNNPFKNPNKDRAFRIDVANNVTSDKVVEIISPLTLVSYFYKYLKEPEPIVLVDFDTVFPGENLSINGVNTVNECKLNSEAHRLILKRAVEIATAAYKENNLANITQINNRNN